MTCQGRPTRTSWRALLVNRVPGLVAVTLLVLGLCGRAAACVVDADCFSFDPCHVNVRCANGVCLSDPRNCDDGNACTIDSCQPGVGCVFSPRDCGLPPDAGHDAILTPDAPANDTGADTLVDLGGDAIVADSLMSDAPPTVDTGADVAAPDAGVDAGGMGADAAVDGGDAGGSDVLDAAGDLAGTPPDLRVRGGGCACALQGTGGDAGTLALVIGVTLLGASRRRARPAKR